MSDYPNTTKSIPAKGMKYSIVVYWRKDGVEGHTETYMATRDKRKIRRMFRETSDAKITWINWWYL